ncbi:unnamed protein product [Gongylonema pulchrum]|uniref:Uncharacterized protein n=1 Tax=Gongylonema pulchrum TaxID=637853 RepID=A0A183DWV5_9BILA|nr:unnamed protein product [Gongylonema pulchrum]
MPVFHGFTVFQRSENALDFAIGPRISLDWMYEAENALSIQRLECSQRNNGLKALDLGFIDRYHTSRHEACQCFTDSLSSKDPKMRSTSLSGREFLLIGCTRQKMLQVFSALNAYNETMVSKLWI